MKLIGRLGDRLLTRLVPRTTAQAVSACSTRFYYWYKCQYTYLYRCYRCSCTPIGHCD